MAIAEKEALTLPEEETGKLKESLLVTIDSELMDRLYAFAKTPSAKQKFAAMAINLMLEVYEGRRNMPPENPNYKK